MINKFVNCVKRGVKSGFHKVMDSRPVRCCVGVALGLFASTCKALADSGAGYEAGKNAPVCPHRHQALLCHCRCRGHRRCHLRVCEDEQRGTGCEEVYHDDHRCMCVPDCSSPGSASVLRY